MTDFVKYGGTYIAYKVLNTEADIVGGQYEVYATLTHEWGGAVVAKTRATRTSSKNYTISYSELNLRMNGLYKIKWEYIIGGNTYVDYDSVIVYTPYISSEEFFDSYVYLNNADNDNAFDSIERKVRNIIHTYCGQVFEYYPGITFSIDGTGGNALPLPMRIESLASVIATVSSSTGTSSSDESDYIQVANDSNWFIEWKNDIIVFKPSVVYAVTGDWGWFYVPDNVKQAAGLLIAEQFNDDNAYRNHGVTDIYMDTHRMRITEEILWNSTGYIDADVLLMDYMKYQIDWI